jgi:hypothetical protein
VAWIQFPPNAAVTQPCVFVPGRIVAGVNIAGIAFGTLLALVLLALVLNAVPPDQRARNDVADLK